MWYITIGVVCYLLGFGSCVWYYKRVIGDYVKSRRLADRIMRDIENGSN